MNYDKEYIASLIKPGQVHRSIYTDPLLFDLEMEKIFKVAWNYVGHESQVPAQGDFITSQVANQPVVMVRQQDRNIKVLHNSCAHRAAIVVAEKTGNTKTFRCCYHGWTYKQDGSLLSIPNQAGYDKTPDFDKTKLSLTELRTETYRGFVFATFNKDGHGLTDSLGGVIRSLDIMVDRSPDNELEIAGGCFRALYRNNWKIYLENLHDGMHPMFVHRSSITASQEQAKKFNNKNDIPLAVQIVKANEQDLAAMEELEVSCYENGHSDMRGFRKPVDEDDPVYREYFRQLERVLGEAKARDVTETNLHNANFYPNMSIHPGFLQIRVLYPVAVDKTMVEIYVLRLKGAPEEFHQRNITYANTVHSPSSIIKVDDLEAYQRVQDGAQPIGSEWVSQHSGLVNADDDMATSTALNERYVRHQYRAWKNYMAS